MTQFLPEPSAPAVPVERELWQKELLESYSSVEELAVAGLLTSDEASRLSALGELYRVRVPRYYAGLFDNSQLGRFRCPIRLQALPGLAEEDPALPDWARAWSLRAFGRESPWTEDAIGDLKRLAAPRLTHRYGNRAILHVSSLCALYCRFCFRKSHLNDDERTLYDGSLEPALKYVEEHPELRELILTGGDPLSLPDSWLERLLARLERVPHLRHVRIHSRMAVTMPSRLTDGLARRLRAPERLVVSLVSHFNHPRELSDLATSKLGAFRKAGIPLYNQSVLLRGVNDDERTLGALFQELYELGVSPFYLHHPDWTPGTFGFRLPITRGQELITRLQGRLSGPAVPRYVVDLPDGFGKVPLGGPGVRKVEERVENGLGGALYELDTPATRHGVNTPPRLYAEFWKA